MPGLFAKAGFNFEYSKEDKVIHAIETRSSDKCFSKGDSNNGGTSIIKQLFFSLFVSYRFGMIIDPLDPESNKFSNIFRRKKE